MAVTRLDRMLGLLLLLVVVATALAYSLCLPEARLAAVSDFVADKRVFQHLLPWISCGYSPLILKEAVLLTVALAALFVFTWIKVRGLWLGVETAALAGTSGWRGLATSPQMWLSGWLVYGAASVFWSPVFQQSLEVWVCMAAGSAVALMGLSLPVTRGFVVKFMGIVLGCGVVLAVIALLQHLQMVSWLPSSSDPRNRMSSLIGHNTGLSAWLMFPLSYGIYFGFTNRRVWIRAGAWAAAGLFVLVIIAAQSRAVWALGLVIIFVVPWKMMRLTTRRLSLTKVLLVCVITLAAVLALMISPQTNPLARLPVSLGERLTGHVFNLDQLRRETRLRILVVSMTELVPKAPVFGTGLGSFEWVYPEAQGAYFRKNPETRLGTTTKRTDLAHNDYLQVLVETGVVGVFLLGGCVFFFLRDMWSVRRGLDRAENRALWWALGVPVGAVMAHATVDFPMHVAPIAVLTLMSAVLCRRLDFVEDVQRGAGFDGVGEDEGQRVPAWRATAVSLGIVMVVFAWTPWVFSAMVGRILVSDSYFNSGRAHLDRFYDSKGQTMPYKLQALERARRYFREAVIINVFNGEAYEGQATAYVNRAALAAHEYTSAMADGPSSYTLLMRSQVERDTEATTNVIANQMASGGLRYHFTYYLLGRAWRLRWDLERGEVAPEDSVAYEQAVAAMRSAVDFNPADAVSLRELADLLAQSPRTAAEAHRVLQRLLKIDPFSAREILILPAIEVASEGDIHAARAMVDPLIEAYPDDAATMAVRAWLGFYQAVWPPQALDRIDRRDEYLQWRRSNLGDAWAFVAALPDTEPYREDKRRLELLIAAASGELELAQELAQKRLGEDPDNAEALVIRAWAQHERFGGGHRAVDSLDYYRTFAVFSVYFMEQPQQGLVWAGELYAKGGKLTVAQARRLASFCVANDLWVVLERTLPGIREDYPGDAMLADIARQVEARR